MRLSILNHSIVVLAVALLAGCAAPHRKGIVYSNTVVPAKESVVFGEIIKNSDVSGSVGVINTTHLNPVLGQPVEDARTFFCWHMPPGKYAVWNLTTTGGSKPWWANYSISRVHLYAEFEVNRPGQIIYVGRLELKFGQGRMSASVADDFDNGLKELKSKFPHLNGESVKQLLQIQPEK